MEKIHKLEANETRDYFTAGELASLFGISKQTLLYYDKIHLLSPDFISENGYRHYSVEQYLYLEIIVNLRSLNISIAEIKKYLDARGKENFLEQLEKKEAECQKIIRENERILNSLAKIRGALATHRNLPLEQITVCWREQRLLRLTEVSPADDAKNRIAKYARHSRVLTHYRGFVEKQAGWIIGQEDFFQKREYLQSTAYFSFSEPGGHGKAPKVALATGLYLEIYFQGTFYRQAEALREKITRFLEINALAAESDIFILPIENHWLCPEPEDYINLLFFRVHNLEKNSSK